MKQFFPFLVLSLSQGVQADDAEYRDALSKLYWGTNGPHWTRNGNWLNSEDLCEWEGVVCDPDTGSITSLLLMNNTLYGTLPSEVGLLPLTESFDISMNFIYGTIPKELSGLTGAKSWDMGQNYLSGTIPCEFGLLRSVTDFNLDFNQLRGTIPTWFGLMTQLLDDFELSHNSLTGTIPTELGLLTSLTDDFELDHNQLTGTIPPELGQLTSLSNDFELQFNLLTGRVPTELGKLTSLGLEGPDPVAVRSPRTFRRHNKNRKYRQFFVMDNDDTDDEEDDRCLSEGLFPDWNLLAAESIEISHTDVQGRVQCCGEVAVDTITIGGSTTQLWPVAPDDVDGGVGFRVCDELSWSGSGSVYNGWAVLPEDNEVSGDVSFLGGSVVCSNETIDDDFIGQKYRQASRSIGDPSSADLCAPRLGGCDGLCSEDMEDALDLNALLYNNSEYFGCSWPEVGNNGDGNPQILSFGKGMEAENTTGATYLCVDNSQLVAATTINLHYNSSQTFLVINVMNAINAGKYQNMSFQQHGLDNMPDAYRKTVWNFHGTTNLQMGQLGWAGTIVAPQADVNCNDGNYNGNMYVNSFSGNCEGHWFPPLVPLGLECLQPWEEIEHDCDFRLRENSLTGTIPSELGRLSQLDGEFGLNNLRLTGPVPSQLGQLTMVTRFSLATNQLLCDDLPVEVALLENSSNMLYFDVDGTDLGTPCCDVIPDLYTCL